jgi:hypothetical protein
LGQENEQGCRNTEEREEFIRRTGVLPGSLKENEGGASWGVEEDVEEVVWMIVRSVLGL